jgi:hypothetical protein
MVSALLSQPVGVSPVLPPVDGFELLPPLVLVVLLRSPPLLVLLSSPPLLLPAFELAAGELEPPHAPSSAEPKIKMLPSVSAFLNIVMPR